LSGAFETFTASIGVHAAPITTATASTRRITET
jgi:hypothetical protein